MSNGAYRDADKPDLMNVLDGRSGALTSSTGRAFHAFGASTTRDGHANDRKCPAYGGFRSNPGRRGGHPRGERRHDVDRRVMPTATAAGHFAEPAHRDTHANLGHFSNSKHDTNKADSDRDRSGQPLRQCRVTTAEQRARGCGSVDGQHVGGRRERPRCHYPVASDSRDRSGTRLQQWLRQ